MSEEIVRIGNTPLSISTYAAENKPTRMNPAGTVEIIFCLKGSVRFNYAYEEFTLQAGEIIAVDKDAYYLYKGKDNLCVSFFIDLERYKEKYPHIKDMLFVCEGLAEGTTNYPQYLYDNLKGLLISALKEITEECRDSVIELITERIVDLFANHFDIIFFLYGSQDIDKITQERLNMIMEYFIDHIQEKITLEAVAAHVRLSPGYISEMMRKYSTGFMGMLMYLRANASEKYLLETDLTIMKISELCGFSDPKYYYAAFRRWYLCTPRQFREKYGKSIPNEVQYYDVSETKGIIDELMVEHYKELFLR
jgi:AraC-like DNA-binding protein